MNGIKIAGTPAGVRYYCPKQKPRKMTDGRLSNSRPEQERKLVQVKVKVKVPILVIRALDLTKQPAHT